MLPRCSKDTPGRHLANAVPATEPDVRPHGTRRNRNAAKENAPNERSLHSNRDDRTEFFFLNVVEEDSDDPRMRFPLARRRRVALPVAGPRRAAVVSPVAALASDGTARGEPHALSRYGDMPIGRSTSANPEPPNGTLHCNSCCEHTRGGNGSGIPSEGSGATRCGRRELVHSNVLKDAEMGPRELCPGRSSLGLKLRTSIRGDSIHDGIISHAANRHPRYPHSSPMQVVQPMATHLRLSSPTPTDGMAEFS